MARTVKTVNQTTGTVGGAKYVVVHSDQSGSIRIGGVDSGADLTATTEGETITEMYISKIAVAANGCGFDVYRGANLIGSFTGTSVMDFQEENLRVETGGDAQANVVFTKSAGGAGTITIRLHKSSGAQ